MTGYTIVGANDLTAAKAFYAALLAEFGMAKLFDHPSGGALYGKDGALQFGVLGPFDGAPHHPGNGQMTALAASSRADVARIHARALELGGSNEGDPGPRGGDDSPFFGSYFRDPSGNKLCIFNWAAG